MPDYSQLLLIPTLTGTTSTPVTVNIGVGMGVNDPNGQDGTEITITITAHNYSASVTATNLQFTDTTAGLTGVLQSATPDTGSYNAGVWDIDSLAPGAEAALVLVILLDADASATSPQTATVTLTGISQSETDSANDSAMITLEPSAVIPPPDIDLQVSAGVSNGTPGRRGDH